MKYGELETRTTLWAGRRMLPRSRISTSQSWFLLRSWLRVKKARPGWESSLSITAVGSLSYSKTGEGIFPWDDDSMSERKITRKM